MRVTFLLVFALALGCSKTTPSGPDSAQASKKGAAEPPVNLMTGKPIGKPGEKLIVANGTFLRKQADDKQSPPGGIVTGRVVSSNPFDGVVEADFLRIIPSGKSEWEYEVRAVGKRPVRFRAKKDSMRAKALSTDTGILFTSDATMEHDVGITWLEQAHEIVGRDGGVVFRSSQ